jgi:hypothetical protein
MRNLKYVDIVLVKQQVDSGRLKTKLDAFGNIYLEDTMAGEAVKIGKLPDGYSFKPERKYPKGKWLPAVFYPHSNINTFTHCEEGWECSECGIAVSDKYDWCPSCGIDMREDKKPSEEFLEYLDTL